MGVLGERRTHRSPGRTVAWPPALVSQQGSWGLCEARLTSKPPSSFKHSNVFSVFVDIMNPQPRAGFLFCCGPEHQARIGVEAGGRDFSGAVAETEGQRPFPTLSAILHPSGVTGTSPPGWCGTLESCPADKAPPPPLNASLSSLCF